MDIKGVANRIHENSNSIFKVLDFLNSMLDIIFKFIFGSMVITLFIIDVCKIPIQCDVLEVKTECGYLFIAFMCYLLLLCSFTVAKLFKRE